MMRAGSMDRGLMSCACAVTADAISAAMTIDSRCGTIQAILRWECGSKLRQVCEICHYQRAELIACRAGVREAVRLRSYCLLEKISYHPTIAERRCSSNVQVEHFFSNGFGDACVELVALFLSESSEDPSGSPSP